MKSFFYKTILPLLLVAITFASYYHFGNSQSGISSESKNILDTIVTIRTPRDNQQLNEKAFEIMAGVEELGEWHQSDSKINKVIARKAEVPAELSELIDESLRYARLTDGAFDPTVRPLVKLWGIGAKDYLPEKKEISEALAEVGFKKLGARIKDSDLGRIDLGGILKGKAIDRAAEYLIRNKVTDFLISTVSSTKTNGNKGSGSPWLIGVENPRPDGSGKPMIAVLKLDGEYSVSTSGDYQRFFIKKNKRYSHILDPNTGYPADNAISVTIVTKRSAAYADAMSTAIFVMGYPEGLRFIEKLEKTEALIVDKKGLIHLSTGMRDLLKSSEGSIY